jgi:hypothetical protein
MNSRRCSVCGLIVCVSFGLAGEPVESTHPHDERPSIVATVQVRPRHADHSHEEHGAFAGLHSRKPPSGDFVHRFWSGNDSKPFWSGDNSRKFWSPESSGTYYSVVAG